MSVRAGTQRGLTLNSRGAGGPWGPQAILLCTGDTLDCTLPAATPGGSWCSGCPGSLRAGPGPCASHLREDAPPPAPASLSTALSPCSGLPIGRRKGRFSCGKRMRKPFPAVSPMGAAARAQLCRPPATPRLTPSCLTCPLPGSLGGAAPSP